MLKNALVCLDATDGNLACQGAAIHFAKHYGATLTGLFVTEPPILSSGTELANMMGAGVLADSSMLSTDWELEAGKLERRAFHAFLESTRVSGVLGVTESVTGPVLESIAHFAGVSDIVFMGRGRDPQTSLLGSAASYVVRRASRPFVLASDMLRDFSRVMVAFDDSEAANRALAAAAEIALGWRGPRISLGVLVVGTEESMGRQCFESARRYLEPLGLTYEPILHPGPPERVIPAIADQWKPGLLCLGAYGHSLIREMVLGSTTQAVIAHRREPLLLCH